MELNRFGNAAYSQPEDAVGRDPEKSTIHVIFRSFGLGSEKTSDFYVNFKWDDVEKLIAEFAVMKEPAAIRLQHSKLLGIAAGRAGWFPKEVA